MEIYEINTHTFKAGEHINAFLEDYLPQMQEKDVVVITEKILTLSQNRTIPATDTEDAIRCESSKTIHTSWGTLARTEAGWCINAGIDASNAPAGHYTLLPHAPFKEASRIQQFLRRCRRLSRLGILIIDTRTAPLRKGSTAVALGVAGFSPFRNYVDRSDLYGEHITRTQTNQADALAASSNLVMGEGAEQTPLALIRDAPLTFYGTELQPEEKQLWCDPGEDLYTQVYINEI